jgi:DNA-binding GntR family transcriptional regulator
METRFETKQDYAYRVIKELIVSGALLPGQRIVVDRMAAEIGTSAIPVREALVRLETERLVNIKPHIGAVVALITPDRVRNIIESVAVLEGYATALAHPRISDVLPRLDAFTATMERASESEEWERFSDANRAFHFAIYEVCDNDVLVQTIEQLWAQLDSYLSTAPFTLMPDRAKGSTAEHRAIIALLASSEVDLVALEAIARHHKMNTAKRLIAG